MALATLEDRLAALEALRDDPHVDDAKAALRHALSLKSNYVVAKAASVITEGAVAGFTREMCDAFDVFMHEPVKRDKGCVAKAGLAEALQHTATEVESDEVCELVFRVGIHHVQMEPVFGGRVDTASELRGHCAFGLVRANDPDVMMYLADLLADKEVPARSAACRALAYSERDEALVLLRYKAAIGDVDAGAGIANPSRQFGSQVLLELLAGDDLAGRFEQRTDDDARPTGVDSTADRFDSVLGLPAQHCHLVEPAIGTRGGHSQFLAQTPEAEQPDAEFAVNPLSLRPVEVPFHRIADVGGDVGEVGPAVVVGLHATAVVVDFEKDPPLDLAADDLDLPSAGVDRILGQLANCFEGMGLRLRNDVNGVPLIADSQPSGRCRCHGSPVPIPSDEAFGFPAELLNMPSCQRRSQRRNSPVVGKHCCTRIHKTMTARVACGP